MRCPARAGSFRPCRFEEEPCLGEIRRAESVDDLVGDIREFLPNRAKAIPAPGCEHVHPLHKHQALGASRSQPVQWAKPLQAARPATLSLQHVHVLALVVLRRGFSSALIPG